MTTNTKPAIDGGMVSTDNEAFAARMDILSFHGLSSDAWNRYAPGGLLTR